MVDITQAAAYDQEEDDREDPYLEYRAQQGVVGRIEVALLRIGLLVSKVGKNWSKKLKEMVRRAWDDYMGFNYVGDLESGNLIGAGRPT